MHIMQSYRPACCSCNRYIQTIYTIWFSTHTITCFYQNHGQNVNCCCVYKLTTVWLQAIAMTSNYSFQRPMHQEMVSPRHLAFARSSFFEFCMVVGFASAQNNVQQLADFQVICGISELEFKCPDKIQTRFYTKIAVCSHTIQLHVRKCIYKYDTYLFCITRLKHTLEHDPLGLYPIKSTIFQEPSRLQAQNLTGTILLAGTC